MLQCCADTQLLVVLKQSSHLAALVVAEGLLDRVVQAARAGPTDALSPPALRVVSTVVNQLLEAAQQAAKQPAVASGTEASAAAEARAAHISAAAHARQSMGSSTRADVAHLSQHSSDWLPPTRRLAAALLAWWRRPEAQAAAARSCAYLRCANLGGEGRPTARQGAGNQRCRWVDDGMGEECRCRCHSMPCMRVCTWEEAAASHTAPCTVPYPPCSACRAVWYCGTACSHADWRAGHRRVCKVLGAARAAEKEQRQATAAAAAEAEAEGQEE